VIDRRTFLAGTGAVVLAAPSLIEAQQAGKAYRVGVLTVAPLDSAMHLLRHFDEGLRDLGYVEGRNSILEA